MTEDALPFYHLYHLYLDRQLRMVQGIIDLGIMLLIAAPLRYVVASLVIFMLQRDLVFVDIGLALIVMLSTNVGVACYER